jgi:hypothetical protein
VLVQAWRTPRARHCRRNMASNLACAVGTSPITLTCRNPSCVGPTPTTWMPSALSRSTGRACISSNKRASVLGASLWISQTPGRIASNSSRTDDGASKAKALASPTPGAPDTRCSAPLPPPSGHRPPRRASSESPSGSHRRQCTEGQGNWTPEPSCVHDQWESSPPPDSTPEPHDLRGHSGTLAQRSVLSPDE